MTSRNSSYSLDFICVGVSLAVLAVGSAACWLTLHDHFGPKPAPEGLFNVVDSPSVLQKNRFSPTEQPAATPSSPAPDSALPPAAGAAAQLTPSIHGKNDLFPPGYSHILESNFRAPPKSRNAYKMSSKNPPDPEFGREGRAPGADVSPDLREELLARQRDAWDVATEQGWEPVGSFDEDSGHELMAIRDGRLYVYATDNTMAALSTATRHARSRVSGLDGQGVTVGVWDQGAVRPSHTEFQGRAQVMDGGTPVSHATHAAGTIAAAGLAAEAEGMAPRSRVDSYDWSTDLAEMAGRAMRDPGDAEAIQVSSHSYGFIAGWAYQYNPPRWYGHVGESESIRFGQYEWYASRWDDVCHQAPYFLPFKSAGNNRQDRAPASGATFAYYDDGWVEKAYDPDSDPAGDRDANDGYDTIALIGNAKNIVTVGAVHDAVRSGDRSIAAAGMTTFSGWGPADDGRVKPDIVANGTSLYSARATDDRAYGYMTGTSMATPNAAGSAALIVQHYRDLFGGTRIRASTLKGLILHTADDLGRPGPDYVFGWGLMNTARAIDLLALHKQSPEVGTLHETTLLTGTTNTYAFSWEGQGVFKATLCWTDPAGDPVYDLDNRSSRLVNDLDVRIIDPAGRVLEPFVLDPERPAAVAERGDNVVDNTEQVLVDAPSPAGVYTVRVTGKALLHGDAQDYALLVSGVQAGGADPDTTPPDSTLPDDLTVTDGDGDGLSDDDEVALYGTDPEDADTDGDGLTDGFEILAAGSDPRAADTDGDGLSDYEEVVVTRTDPATPDSDGDGIGDALASAPSEGTPVCSGPRVLDEDNPGAHPLRTRHPVYAWDSSGEPVWYQLEIRRRQNGRLTLYRRAWAKAWTQSGRTVSWMDPGPGLHSNTYTWRVRAYGFAGKKKYGPWSTYAPDFSVAIGAPSVVPQLRSLAGTALPAQTSGGGTGGDFMDGPVSVTDVGGLVFSWAASPRATAYEIEVETPGKGGAWTRSRAVTVSGAEPDTTGTISADPALGLRRGRYRWRVRAKNVDGVSAWCANPPWGYFNVLIDPPSEAPTGLYPDQAHHLARRRPVFRWNVCENAAGYKIEVERLRGSQWKRFGSASVKAGSLAGDEGALTWPSSWDLGVLGDFRWRVSATNPDGAGPASAWAYFSLRIPAPTAPRAISPDRVQLDQRRLVLVWSPADLATAYVLQLERRSGRRWRQLAKKSLDLNQLHLGGGSVIHALEQGLKDTGEYRWRVRASNQGVSGPWSEFAAFTLHPMAGPEGTGHDVAAGSRIPDFAWHGVDGARMYYLEIEYLSGARWKVYRKKWIDHDLDSVDQVWQAVDQGGLKSATYRWRVRAWNDDGFGEWSDYSAPFVIDVGRPVGTPELSSPTGGVDVPGGRPALTWSAVDRATGYYVRMQRDGKTWNLAQNGKTVKEAWAGGTEYVPEKDLQFGTYRWWVRAWNPDGFSFDGYSNAGTFTRGAVRQLGPDRPVSGEMPAVLAWEPVAGADAYEIQLRREYKGKLVAWKTIRGLPGSASSYALPYSLGPGTDYAWSIRALPANSKYKGPWSTRGLRVD